MEKKIKEGIHLKKKKRFVKQKISGKIFVLMGLAIILAIAAYTFILQSAYTKTALETEISRDRASADAVHKLVDGKIGWEDFHKSRIVQMKKHGSIRIFPAISMRSGH